MIRYQITDRRAFESLDQLVANIIASSAGWIQIREKDLPDRALASLVSRAVAAAPGKKILVNSRADIALARGAHGVHLPSGAFSPAALRRITPAGFLIGVSCHSVDEVERAGREGADFVVFGPVFPPRSKQTSTPPAGLDGLAAACRASSIPVLALGGITTENSADCLTAGAAGIAAITLFLA